MIWMCYIVIVVGGVWADERFPGETSSHMTAEQMDRNKIKYDLHQETKEIFPGNKVKLLEVIDRVRKHEDPAPWSSSRVCCWNAPSWPVSPPSKFPTFPPFNPMPALAKPFVPSVTLPTWTTLKTSMLQFPTSDLPQLTLRVPTYPPFKSIPPIKYPTWTQGFPTLAPWNPVSFNYTRPVPTYHPLKTLPLSPVFQLPYYPPLKYDVIPNYFPVQCPCRNSLPFAYFSGKPEKAATNSQIQGVIRDIPYVKINVTSVGVNGSDHKSVNMEVPNQLSSGTQLFDVGNTETVNNVTIVVLNNCEKAKSDVQCAGKSAFNYGPSKDQNELENGVDYGEVTELLSALLQQVSLLDNENLYMLRNDQHSVSTSNKHGLATVISSLKPDRISGAYSNVPIDLVKMIGMPVVKESQLTKQALPLFPGKGGWEEPALGTALGKDNAFVGRQQSGAVSPPKTEDSEGGSSSQVPNPASSGSDSAASQVTIPGSVGVEDSRPSASSTVEPSLPETTTNSTTTV